MVSLHDLRRVCDEIGESITDEEIQEMIEEADQDQDGYISQEEFIRILFSPYDHIVAFEYSAVDVPKFQSQQE